MRLRAHHAHGAVNWEVVRAITLGIVAGGLVILINFHLLARVLKSGLNPGQLTTPAGSAERSA